MSVDRPLPFLNENQFSYILGRNIRPGAPIDTVELLQGRENILKEIRRTLQSPGMHVFVHGERGVGKSSLALTAAKSILQKDAPCVGCDEATTVEGLVLDICRVLVGSSLLGGNTTVSGVLGINLGFIKAEAKADQKERLPERVISINQAAILLGEAVKASKRDEALVIIDELDRVQRPEFKVQFADLIKRLHDFRVPIRFIMCGIGRNLDEIIGSHLSASRAITPFVIAPLSHDARWAIIRNAANELGFTVPNEFLIRTGQISEGYPYYVHLIAYHLLWTLYEHSNASRMADSADFHKAVLLSVERAEAPLRKSYNDAIQKTTNSLDYEEALWAIAEDTHFERQLKEVYEKSYLNVMSQRTKRVPIDIERFRQRLYRLCDEHHGSIIVRKRNSWYAFRENLQRGYVRLVAQRNDVILGSDHF